MTRLRVEAPPHAPPFPRRENQNPVVIAGDTHPNWTHKLIADFDPLGSRSVAAKFVDSSLTSNGNGTTKPTSTDPLFTQNPFVKFCHAAHGYVRDEITPQPGCPGSCRDEKVTDPTTPLNSLPTFSSNPTARNFRTPTV